MKNYPTAVMLVLVLMGSCQKSNDYQDEPHDCLQVLLDCQQVRLKQIVNAENTADSKTFLYDSLNMLEQCKSILSYQVYYTPDGRIDYFEGNADAFPLKVEYNEWEVSVISQNWMNRYTFNEQNQLVRSEFECLKTSGICEYGMTPISSDGQNLLGIYRFESISLYSWENGNPVKVINYLGLELTETREPDWVENYTYDNKKNPYTGCLHFLIMENSTYGSANNVTSWMSISKKGDFTLSGNYEYTYNLLGYPGSRKAADIKYDFKYECAD
jgi:hypothetical protein